MTEIASVMIIPLRRGSADFAQLTLRLTDLEDDSIYMEVNFVLNRWWAYGTFVNVSTNATSAMGYKWGEDGSQPDPGGFEGHFISFMGITNADMDAEFKGFQVFYDSKKMTVYARDHFNKILPVLRLTDYESVGYGNIWSGFTSGRAKLSFTAKGISGNKAQYLITSIAGQSLSGTVINDVTSPSLNVDIDKNESLIAKTGFEYKIPSYSAIDLVDGNNINKYVLVTSPTNHEYIVENSFTPTETGKYNIRYTAIDTSGNKNEYTYDLISKYDTESLKIDVEETETNISVGYSKKLPLFTISGGSGRIEYKTSLIRLSDNREIDISNGEFTPTINGEYVYLIEAVDWIGTKVSKMIKFTATYDTKPVIESEINMFKRFIDGYKVEIPMFKAYDVKTIVGGKVSAKQTIKAYGIGDKSSYSEDINGIFVPTIEKFGPSVRLVYTISQDGLNDLVKEYTIPIITVKQLGDYFVTDGFDISYSSTNLIFTSTSENPEATFINPLISSNASIQFRIDSETQDFEKAYVTLTDSMDKSLSITLEIIRNGSSSFVDIDGERYSMNGSLNGDSKDSIVIAYNDNTKTFTDVRGRKITTIDKLNEKEFKGFSSGKVFLIFGLENVTGDAILYAEKINNQSLYADYEKGKLIDFVDYTLPSIELSGGITTATEKGKINTLPSAKAFDVLSFCCDIDLTVISPSGKKILNRVDCSKANDIEITETGSYSVTYRLVDASNKVQIVEYQIVCADNEAPTIYVDKSDIHIKVGEILQLQKGIILDNETDEPTEYIFIYNSHSEVFVVENYSFTPTEKGIYTIRYYAADDFNNISMVDIKLIVD